MKALLRNSFVAFIVLAIPLAHAAPARNAEWLSISGPRASAPVTPILSKPSSGEGVEIELKIVGAERSKVEIQSRRFDQISIPGYGATAEQFGLPELPFKGFFLEIPHGMDIDVQLAPCKTVSLGKGYRIIPLQRPPVDMAGVPEPPFEMDAAAYARDSFYPKKPLIVGKPGIIRGRKVVFVQVFPLSYNPATTELRACASMRLIARFKGKRDEASENRKRVLSGPPWENLAERLILNYERGGPALLR